MKVAPQIFVVHGALGSAVQMEPIAHALESLGDVHNVELPGHGQTPLPAGSDFSIDTFTDALALAIGRASHDATVKRFVFGYSMGGYVALALEANRPGTFAGILTLGTKFAWTPALALRDGSRLNADIIAEKVPKFATALEERHRNTGGWKLVLDRTANLLVQLGDKPILTRQSLGGVQARTCIAVGERDDTVSADEAREYAGYVPNARAEVLPDTPHSIERVSAEAIAEQMRTLI